MKLVFLALLLLVLAVSATLVINKKELAYKMAPLSFNVKDFPEHGIFLIAPSQTSKTQSPSIAQSYSVFLKNDGSRAVVGYSIKWECIDGSGKTSERDTSKDLNLRHIDSWIFLHGEEADHTAALNRSHEFIKPNSTWFISPSSPPHPVERDANGLPFGVTEIDGGAGNEPLKSCVNVTIIADGIFFDDGTFIGPDTTGLFLEAKSQMDARYEILQGVENELKAGKQPAEIFNGLERIIDPKGVRLGEHPTKDEFRSYFRSLFARDILGKKEFLGNEKAIADVQLQLSKPWVNLRKL